MINERLINPQVVSDNKLYRELMREHKQLSPIVEAFRAYAKAKAEMEEAREMMDAGGLDRDFRVVVEEQYTESQAAMERLTDELRVLLCRDPNDDRNVIVEIRGEPAVKKRRSLPAACCVCTPLYAEPPVEMRDAQR